MIQLKISGAKPGKS